MENVADLGPSPLPPPLTQPATYSLSLSGLPHPPTPPPIKHQHLTMKFRLNFDPSHLAHRPAPVQLRSLERCRQLRSRVMHRVDLTKTLPTTVHSTVVLHLVRVAMPFFDMEQLPPRPMETLPMEEAARPAPKPWPPPMPRPQPRPRRTSGPSSRSSSLYRSPRSHSGSLYRSP